MNKWSTIGVSLLLSFGAMAGFQSCSPKKGTFLLNGEPFVVKAAELHYPRIPRAYWEHRIKQCKALGMNTICLYVFWNFHEEKPGEFDFTGQKDLAEFCRRTICMSSFAPDRMYVPNGKWAVCLGGF